MCLEKCCFTALQNAQYIADLQLAPKKSAYTLALL